MSDPRSRGMTEEQCEDLICNLPRREPPPGLRGRVLAHAGPRRASLLQPRFALAALLLLLALDVGVLRWQGSGMTAPPSLPSSLPPSLVKQDDDLLLLVQETYHGGLWTRAFAGRPAPAETYLQLRERVLNTVDRG
jgi:hypothetical protein